MGQREVLEWFEEKARVAPGKFFSMREVVAVFGASARQDVNTLVRYRALEHHLAGDVFDFWREYRLVKKNGK